MKKHEIEPMENQEILEFDFSEFGKNAGFVKGEIEAIRKAGEKAGAAVMEIGKRLSGLKNSCDHGQWMKVLEILGVNHQYAMAYVNGYNTFKDCPNVSLIGKSAIQLLAAPSTPQEARDEAIAQAAAGKTVKHKDAKSIIDKAKPKRERKPRSKPSDDTIDGEEIIERDHDDEGEPLADICEPLVEGKNCGVIKDTKWGREMWFRIHPDWDKKKILAEIRSMLLRYHSVAAHHLEKHCETWEEGAQAALDEMVGAVNDYAADPERW